MIRLSIIIPTFRRTHSVLRLLDSVVNQKLAPESYETLIVSNFDDQRLAKALEQASGKPENTRLLVAARAGANASRNLGLRESNGKILFFLDDDCVLTDPEYLNRVLSLHEEYPAALAIGGAYSIPAGSRLEDIAYNLISREWQANEVPGRHESVKLIGGNVSYKKGMLTEIGVFFNPEITYGGAELEFHHRLVNKGAQLLLFPDLLVDHLPEIDDAELIKKAFKQAVTTTKFSITESPSQSPLLAYQRQRAVQALKYAASEWELRKICSFMERYDEVYNIVIRERIDTLTRLKLRLRGWKAKARTGVAREAQW